MTIQTRSWGSPHQAVHADLTGDDVFDVAIPLPSQPNRTVRATSIKLTVTIEHVSWEVTRGPLLLRSTGEPGKQSLQTPVRLQAEQVPLEVRRMALERANNNIGAHRAAILGALSEVVSP